MASVSLSKVNDIQLSLPAHQQLWLALSGGLDSIVLLDLAVRWCQAESKSLKVLHVHHGLSPNADQWADHCQQLCKQYQQQFSIKISCQVHQVQLNQQLSSLEAQARKARYHIFEQQLQKDDLLLMAHHADDQAETLLLRLLRGAGSQGLSAMPAFRTLGRGQLYRPLLSYNRAQLEQYAHQQQLRWVEDESNQCTDFDRNYLRHEILPRLKQRWPASSELFSRAAQNLAESAALNEDLAELDLQQTLVSTTFGEAINCDLLQGLSRPRQINLLRFWFKAQAMPELERKQWQIIFNEVVEAKIDAEPCFNWQGYQLRRFRGLLYLLLPTTKFDADESHLLATLPLSSEQTPISLSINTGVLTLNSAAGFPQKINQDLPIMQLPDSGTLWVRYRQGGETIQLVKRGRKQLKKLLQESDIPPWLRQRLPLIWWQPETGDAQLIAVADLWLSESVLSRSIHQAWLIRWNNEGHS